MSAVQTEYQDRMRPSGRSTSDEHSEPKKHTYTLVYHRGNMTPMGKLTVRAESLTTTIEGPFLHLSFFIGETQVAYAKNVVMWCSDEAEPEIGDAAPDEVSLGTG